MGSEWPLVKLGEYCCKIGSGATPKGGGCVYLDSGDVCLIRSQNIFNEGFNEGGLVYIDEIAATKLRNVVVEHNDILLNITGDSVARVCLVPDAYLPARVNQHVAIIRPNVKHFDARFLRYFLASPKTQILLLNLSSAGATRNALTKSMLENFEVPKPSLDVQVFIANILQSLDNKIINNRQINQTLEQMAQTLFKSWFVDFDPVVDNALDAGFFEQDLAFSEELLHRVEVRKVVRKSDDFKPLPEDIRQLFPDAFEESAEPTLGLGGWVPKGWNNGCISDVAHYRTKRINTSELTLTNYISTENMLVDRKGIQQATALPTVNSVPAYTSGTILISNIRPYFKKIWLAKGDGGYSNDVLGFEVKDLGTEEYLFNLMYQDSFFDFMMATSKGSKMPRGDKKAILGLGLVVPPLKLRKLFSKDVNDFYTSSNTRNDENLILGQLRDTLLPKLISGELSLNDIKIDTPEETRI
ncbi:restriction endonuclease subunit S [Providencia stuartii]|uniref:restriction endonuclease subunit S n=1 Tax=Providencia stuartii TaxID=588 RepID=UPI002882C096|nr:restriction endonuclease subunit S [Providencia stuartii]MDK7735202.1 restriction endonuclease subunit S [Providencia stuartii]